MRIEKEYNLIPTNAKLVDGHSTNNKAGYTCDYLNKHSVVVSPTEPSTDRKKVWLKHSSNLLNKDIWTNAYINSSGTIVSSNNHALFSYIVVKPNTSYTIKTKTSVYLMTVTEYNNSFSFIQRNVSSNDINEYHFTTTANTNFVRIVIQSFSSITITQSIINELEIMVNEGTIALSYEPYVKDKTYILNDNNTYEEFNEDKLLLEAEDTVSLNSGVAVNVETASITVPKDGLALAIVHAVFSGTGGGSRYVNIGVISGDITPKANMQVASGNQAIGISSMRVLDIKTGNIIAPRIEQTSGSAMNVTCRIQLCYL